MKRRVWLKGSGPPPLARQLVIAAIQSLAADRPELAWTVEELARHMAAREYRVRAAVGWLVHQGRVVTALRQRKTVNGRTYAVARYCLLEDKRPTDWAGLYRAFARRGRYFGRGAGFCVGRGLFQGPILGVMRI